MVSYLYSLPLPLSLSPLKCLFFCSLVSAENAVISRGGVCCGYASKIFFHIKALGSLLVRGVTPDWLSLHLPASMTRLWSSLHTQLTNKICYSVSLVAIEWHFLKMKWFEKLVKSWILQVLGCRKVLFPGNNIKREKLLDLMWTISLGKYSSLLFNTSSDIQLWLPLCWEKRFRAE